MNFFDVKLEDPQAPKVVIAGQEVSLSGYEFTRPGLSGDVWFGIRPEHIVTGEAAATAPAQFEVHAELVEPMGSETLVWSSLADTPLRFRVDGQTPVADGDLIRIGFDPARASIFDKVEELRI